MVPPKSSLTAGEIGNDADYLTDLVVGADRSKRYTEYSAAYDKSSIKKEMMGIVGRNAKVCMPWEHTITRIRYVLSRNIQSESIKLCHYYHARSVLVFECKKVFSKVPTVGAVSSGCPGRCSSELCPWLI